jgi:cellulase/cellobiase CelA1
MLTGRGRFVACAAAAVVAIGGAGAALALSQPSAKPPAQTAAALCGLVACAAVPSHGAPAPTPAGGVPSTALGPGGAQTSRPAAPATAAAAPAHRRRPRPEPVTSAAPSPSPSPLPPAAPDVTVTFSAPQFWHRGFQEQITLDNQGSSPASGWQVVISLPGDQVRFVWNAAWQFGGGSLTLTPGSGDQVIEPGTSVTVTFAAFGFTTQPASCTFDGSACR